MESLSDTCRLLLSAWVVFVTSGVDLEDVAVDILKRAKELIESGAFSIDTGHSGKLLFFRLRNDSIVSITNQSDKEVEQDDVNKDLLEEPQRETQGDHSSTN